MTLREAIVDNALWGVDHEPDIHYSQGAKRFAALHTPRTLPLYTDCSAFATLCYAWAGAPDPNGLDYNGTGYTGTLLLNLERINQADLQPGDLVVFGPRGGDHVVIVIEAGADPLTVSHGQEKGPIKVRLSVEARAHRPPVMCLRGAGLDHNLPTPPPEDDMGQITDPDQIAALTRIDDGIAALIDGMHKLDARVSVLEGSVGTELDEHLAEARRNIRAIAKAAGFQAEDGTHGPPVKVTSIADQVAALVKRVNTTKGAQTLRDERHEECP